MIEDKFPNDPFFRRGQNFQLNACIGTQGDEDSYLHGYMQAAIELVDAVLKRNMYEKRDTLILPILYNARHAIELALKFTTMRLLGVGVLKNAPAKSHNIKAYWQALDVARIGDRTLTLLVERLRPFIESLSAIDQDGQELRYHLNTSDDPSLSSYSLANFEVVGSSLAELSTIVLDLTYRTTDFLAERATGTYTKECSRFDLLAITKRLPQMSAWNETSFDQIRMDIRTDFGLSGHQLSSALSVIKNNREMRALLGGESALCCIPDQKIIAALTEWRKLFPRELPTESQPKPFVIKRLEVSRERLDLRDDTIRAFQHLLSTSELTDLTMVYFCGRDWQFCEQYEERFSKTDRVLATDNDLISHYVYLVSKGNLLDAVERGARRLGRLELAGELSKL